MARVKVKLADNIARVVFIDPQATKGATLGSDVYLPNGQIATPATLRDYLGITTSGAPSGTSGSVAGALHSTLSGRSATDAHPQYALVSSLGTAAALNSDNDGTLAANSSTRLPTQAAVKAYVDANAGGDGGLLAVQEADQVTTNNNVFQDTDLVIPLTAGTWRMEAFLDFTPNATPDMEIRLTFTGTQTDVALYRHFARGGTVGEESTFALPFDLTFTVTGRGIMRYWLKIEVSVAGDLKVQTRQVTSSATANTFWRGSWMRAVPLD